MKTFTLTFEYSGEAESWEQIRNDAENNKIPNVFIGSKEFVNVVRCKDCKWFASYTMENKTYKMCKKAHLGSDDFFCADGERKC